MKLTKEHLLELFKQLPTETVCDYVIPGNFTVRRKPIEDYDIHFSLFENGTETQKDVPLTESAMETMANSIIENTPISIDAALVNGGNKRSAIEGALIRTSEFYSIKIGRNKNIVWVPSKPHPVGEKGIWNEDETLPTAPKDDTSSMAVHQEEVSDSYTIEELGKRFAAMADKEDEAGIVTTCVAFGLKYGKAINKNGYKARELVDAANKSGARIDHSQDGNVNIGKSLYMAIERQRFGLHFSKQANNNSKKQQTLHTLSPYLAALRTKPFMLLAGISGTGKSRIVREFAFKSCPDYLRDKDGTTPGNYCMIEVKPNWHDSTELLGYWSNINKRYMFTKFVKFLVKAKMFPEVPFFVCLDEMNLAPVEQYFAEFLSVLETRRLIKNGEGEDEVVSGVLVDKEYFAKLGTLSSTSGTLGTLKTDRDIYFKLFDIQDKVEMEKVENDSDSLLTEGLTLPENVFIVGTVNMDDTTHQFSRKVIDRAMTIEMNGGALADIFKNNSDLTCADEPMTMDDMKSRYITASEVLEKCYAVVNNQEISDYIQGKGEEGLPQRLEEINKVLRGTPFTVSYRVMNELTIYLAVLLDKAVEDGTEVTTDNFKPYVEEAIDKILLMKILPRVEGDDEMFRISDDERNLYGLNNQVDENGISHEYTKLDWLREIAPQHTAEDEQKYMAVDKLKEMIGRLNRQSFTRYWP